MDMTPPMMDARRKRLLYRSNYRGFKEADILLGGFAKAHVKTLSDDELTQFETLLENKDHDIYDWITGKFPAPAEFNTPILAMIRKFKPQL